MWRLNKLPKVTLIKINLKCSRTRKEGGGERASRGEDTETGADGAGLCELPRAKTGLLLREGRVLTHAFMTTLWLLPIGVRWGRRRRGIG